MLTQKINLQIKFCLQQTLRLRALIKIITFKIVGEDEANITLGKISYMSPLAQALIGARIGDEVDWIKPSGNETLIINAISYSS